MPLELAETIAATEEDRLRQAESLVRAYCGWHIAPVKTETVTVDGSGSGVLALRSLHVVGVTSVSDDGTEVASTDYTWRQNGLLIRAGRWGTQKVVVSLTHGYEIVPGEVEAIVQAVAQRAVDNPGSRPREQVGPFGMNYSTTDPNQAPALALLDSEKAALDQYRLPPTP